MEIEVRQQLRKKLLATGLMDCLQEYMQAYIGHAYGDYDYNKPLSKDDIDEIINYLNSALRKAETMQECFDSIDDAVDKAFNERFNEPDELYEIVTYGGFDNVPLVYNQENVYGLREAEAEFNKQVIDCRNSEDEDDKAYLLALFKGDKIIKWATCCSMSNEAAECISSIITYLKAEKVLEG